MPPEKETSGITQSKNHNQRAMVTFAAYGEGIAQPSKLKFHLTLSCNGRNEAFVPLNSANGCTAVCNV
ncbi:hypothetical protein [Paenibacillus senegalensis]|uniref:hypothetical protein n=1 Tax=Paenibacillus senegalensis TaxID=1465766 RepID=UPI000288B586|nr:hypothetical protein [Paenibacillus senegalensis]